MRYPDLVLGSVADMILNWDDENNDIINSTLGIEDMKKLKLLRDSSGFSKYLGFTKLMLTIKIITFY